MLIKITSGAAALAFAAMLSAAPASAAMTPALNNADASFQRVDCAVGFHIGPAGACILGTPDGPPPPRVIEERRAVDPGCQTNTVKHTNGEGDSVTRTSTNCP